MVNNIPLKFPDPERDPDLRRNQMVCCYGGDIPRIEEIFHINNFSATSVVGEKYPYPAQW